MDDKTKEELTRKVIDTINSLDSAVEIAGGNPIHLKRMEGMSLFHFICHVAAPNGIRFVRVNFSEKSEEETDFFDDKDDALEEDV